MTAKSVTPLNPKLPLFFVAFLPQQVVGGDLAVVELHLAGRLRQPAQVPGAHAKRSMPGESTEFIRFMDKSIYLFSEARGLRGYPVP